MKLTGWHDKIIIIIIFWNGILPKRSTDIWESNGLCLIPEDGVLVISLRDLISFFPEDVADEELFELRGKIHIPNIFAKIEKNSWK